MKTGEDKHRLLIENLPDAFAYHQIVMDEDDNPVDYIFLDVNPAFYEMTGFPKDKVIGNKITEIQPEITETNFDWIGTYGKVALTGETIRFEQYSEMADRWYVITAYSDEPGYFAVLFRDITKSKKIEQLLRGQQARLEKTQEIAHVGSWELDLKTNRLYWSDEIYRFFGLMPQEFAATYEAFLEAVHPEDRAAVNEAYSSSLENGRDTYEIEHRVVRKHTGEVRYVHEKCEHVRDALGTVIRSVGMVQDITERKLAEEDLRRREQEFRALVENSPDVVARFDLDLRRLYVNPAVEKHVDIPREELIGRTHAALKVQPQQARLWNSALLDVFQSGCEKELYYDFAIPAGHRYCHSRIVPEFAPDGSIETVLSITRDITTIKKMEAALHMERAKTRRLHQRSLPDDLPVLPGLALAVYYRPAATLQGDYYNLIRRGNQLLIYLVDVDEAKDDGVMQSLYVRNKIEDYLSAHADDAALSPARLLHYLTERYHQEKEPGTSPLCVFIAVLDMPPSGEHENSSIVTAGPSNRVTLRYTSTGFCTPPLVISGSGEPGKLSMDNSYLVPDDGSGLPGDCEEYSFTIVPDSTIVFSTDGLFNQGPDHGSYEPRLREVLRRHAHLPPELINQAVDADFTEFCSDSPLHNDLAFIILQVPEQEQRLHFQVESDFELVSKAKEEVSSLLVSQLRQQPTLLHFHELLVNAMEHGNKRDGGKNVSVDVAVTERYYRITITDQGEGFNWRGKINRELDLDGDSERGRGIIMSRMLTNYLGYNERGNRVTMINMIN